MNELESGMREASIGVADSQIMHPMDEVGDLDASAHPVVDLLRVADGRKIMKGQGTAFDGFRLPNFFGQHDDIPSFAILSFDGCQKALSDPRHFSSDFFAESFTDAVGRGLFCMDPPEHTEYRALIQKGFMPRVVARWDDEIIRPSLERAFDAVVSKGRCDIASDLTLVFAYEIICLILGFPISDLAFVTDRITKMTRGTYDPEAAAAASVEMHAYVGEYIADRRASKVEEDFISALMIAEVDGQRLSDAQLMSFIFHVFPAGMETTFRGASSLAWLLLENPEELEKVRENQELIPAAIAEMLRYEGPASMFPRKVIADTSLEGIEMPAGSMAYIMMAAGNRDESRWERPHDFDVTRPPKANLGFGYGPHACIGMHLARKELDIFTRLMLARMPNVRRDSRIAEMPPILGWTLRSPLSVPAEWDVPGA
jgi:cytochrome P450